MSQIGLFDNQAVAVRNHWSDVWHICDLNDYSIPGAPVFFATPDDVQAWASQHGYVIVGVLANRQAAVPPWRQLAQEHGDNTAPARP